VVSLVGGQLQFIQQGHPLAVVMTQDCDLEQDYFLRFPPEGPSRVPEDVDREQNALKAVILCDAYEAADMESHFPAKLGGKERDLVGKNMNERYHCLGESTTRSGEVIAPLMLDLRTPFAVPAGPLYEQLAVAEMDAVRIGVIPDIHSHDLMHRFYSYQSRVALPPAPTGGAKPLPAAEAGSTTTSAE
jgi:hypothetical protein